MSIRDFALQALETAKEDLFRNKYLIPVAFIVTDEELLDFNLQFEDAEQKASVYRKLVDTAKQKGARAIITLNDARLNDPSEGKNEVKECIYLTASGPSISTWSICLPYERVDDVIVFAEPSESLTDLLNLLPGWPIEEARGEVV